MLYFPFLVIKNYLVRLIRHETYPLIEDVELAKYGYSILVRHATKSVDYHLRLISKAKGLSSPVIFIFGLHIECKRVIGHHELIN